MDWLNLYQRFWSAQLDRLAAFVEKDACPPKHPVKPEPPSTPSLTIKRRLNAPAEKVSSAAWTDPKQLVRWFDPTAGRSRMPRPDLRVGRQICRDLPHRGR